MNNGETSVLVNSTQFWAVEILMADRFADSDDKWLTWAVQENYRVWREVSGLGHTSITDHYPLPGPLPLF